MRFACRSFGLLDGFHIGTISVFSGHAIYRFVLVFMCGCLCVGVCAWVCVGGWVGGCDCVNLVS